MTAKKRIHNVNSETLFSLPVTHLDFAISKIWDLFLPYLLLYPFWIVLFFIFALSIKMPVSEFVLLFIVLTCVFLFVLMSAFTVFLLLFNLNNFNYWHVFTGIVIIILVIMVIINTGKIRHQVFQLLFGAGLPLLIVFFYILAARILAAKFLRQPEYLLLKPQRSQLKSMGKLLDFYLIFTPNKIKAIVKKDCIYILRIYKIFVFYIILSLIVLIGGISKLSVINEGIQWFSSIVIAFAYLIANASFKFNEKYVENLMVIKQLPIPAQRFWLAKFWNGFCPVLWLIILGLTIIFFKFGFEWKIILPSTVVVLFIAFTLIYFQTNFALYSYPFSWYAIAWYNLYIIIAAIFFTALLFPPLTIGFLIFGYAAVFRVFKRFKTVDVLDDQD
ncbi:hypothetical protein JXQ31_05010 [candidate division KSB1 bacterium]|nr:hypothetical protein [candidate division KSB1 bacterium]